MKKAKMSLVVLGGFVAVIAVMAGSTVSRADHYREESRAHRVGYQNGYVKRCGGELSSELLSLEELASADYESGYKEGYADGSGGCGSQVEDEATRREMEEINHKERKQHYSNSRWK